MGHYCVVPGCRSRATNTKLFAVPFTKKAIWGTWLNKCPYLRLYDIRRLANIKICCLHFIPEHINDKNRLTPEAVPKLNLPPVNKNPGHFMSLEVAPLQENTPLKIKVITNYVAVTSSNQESTPTSKEKVTSSTATVPICTNEKDVHFGAINEDSSSIETTSKEKVTSSTDTVLICTDDVHIDEINEESSDAYIVPQNELFSWQKPTETILESDDEITTEEVQNNLLLHCEDEESGGKTHDEHLDNDYVCNYCNEPITGFRYRCVQCADCDLCTRCEAAGRHPEHYVLRVPPDRPHVEVQSVLLRIRSQLLGGDSPLLRGDLLLDSIKEEVKEEEEGELLEQCVEDPLQVGGTQLQAETAEPAPDPVADDDAADTELSAVVPNVQEHNTPLQEKMLCRDKERSISPQVVLEDGLYDVPKALNSPSQHIPPLPSRSTTPRKRQQYNMETSPCPKRKFTLNPVRIDTNHSQAPAAQPNCDYTNKRRLILHLNNAPSLTAPGGSDLLIPPQLINQLLVQQPTVQLKRLSIEETNSTIKSSNGEPASTNILSTKELSIRLSHNVKHQAETLESKLYQPKTNHETGTVFSKYDKRKGQRKPPIVSTQHETLIDVYKISLSDEVAFKETHAVLPVVDESIPSTSKQQKPGPTYYISPIRSDESDIDDSDADPNFRLVPKNKTLSKDVPTKSSLSLSSTSSGSSSSSKSNSSSDTEDDSEQIDPQNAVVTGKKF